MDNGKSQSMDGGAELKFAKPLLSIKPVHGQNETQRLISMPSSGIDPVFAAGI